MPDWYADPPLLLAMLFVVGGFYVLIKGADMLVEGAVNLAKRQGMHPAVIGATIVAFGTSLPELVVTMGSNVKAMQAGVPGDADGPAAIAIGNVVGSNIFNMGAILGLAAMVKTLPVPRSTLRLDYPLMIVALGALILFSVPLGTAGPVIERWEGGLLLIGLIAFTYTAIKLGKVPAEEVEELASHEHSLGGAIGFILLGVLMLTGGGEVSLTGAIEVAEAIGMSDRVIGVTVMAVGTSLPELVTSVQAVRRDHTELAIGNVVGSNIFNVLCIVGLTALIFPLPVAQGTLNWDYWWMMGINLGLLPMFLIGRHVGRVKGVILVVALVTYITLVLTLNPGA